MSAPTPPCVFDVATVAGWLSHSEKWLCDQLRAGRLPARRIGRRWMFTKEDCDAILELCAVGPRRLLDDATPAVSQHSSSMTSTTARRMRRGCKASPTVSRPHRDPRRPDVSHLRGGFDLVFEGGEGSTDATTTRPSSTTSSCSSLTRMIR